MWESQCEESKQVRINDMETCFFQLFSEVVLSSPAWRMQSTLYMEKAHLQSEDQVMNVIKCTHKMTRFQAAVVLHTKYFQL